MKIKKDDKVVIIRGKNRGKVGKVLVALPRELRVVVGGVNIQKKHKRPRKQGEKGQVVEIPGPVRVSNVKLVCKKCGKATRTGRKREGGDTYRVCKQCGEQT